MKKLNIEYIAGLFDADGSIYIHEPKSKKNKFQLRLEIGMCDEKVIKLLKETIGGRIRKYSKKKKSGGYYRDVFVWDLTGEPLTDLLIKLEPFVVVKHTQVRAGITMRLLQEQYKKERLGFTLTQEELAKRLELKKIIKDLNYGRKDEII